MVIPDKIKKLIERAVLSQEQDYIKPLTIEETSVLISYLIRVSGKADESLSEVKKLISEGRLKGEKGDTPVVLSKEESLALVEEIKKQANENIDNGLNKFRVEIEALASILNESGYNDSELREDIAELRKMIPSDNSDNIFKQITEIEQKLTELDTLVKSQDEKFTKQYTQARGTISGGITQARVLQLIAENASGGSVSDEAYGGTWDGVVDEAPSKNAVYDKIQALSLGAGTGDVVGPVSSVDSRIAAFDGTTGKLIKDGGSTIANVLDRTNHTGTQDADTITDGTTNKVYTATEQTKLAGIETAATADQTAAEILTAIKTVDGTASGLDADLLDGNEAAAFATAAQGALADSAQQPPVEGPFVNGDKTKLDGIETGADVTDTTNVTAAGALMDSEVTNLSGIKTLTVPDNTTISTFGATLTDDVDAATARTTLGVDAAGTDNSTNVSLAGTPNYITIVGQVITRALIDLTSHVTGRLPLANVETVATNRIMGRSTAGTGDIEALTATSARTVMGLSTSDSPQFTAVNIGHATDTTLERVSAGVISVEGVTVPTISSTNTLTNKRITKRTGTTTSSASLTIDSDSYDRYTVTALAAAMTINAPTGTPTDGQTLVIRIKDNATGRALTWNAIFRALGTTLPTTTVASKTMYIGCMYNTADTKWDVVAVAEES